MNIILHSHRTVFLVPQWETSVLLLSFQCLKLLVHTSFPVQELHNNNNINTKTEKSLSKTKHGRICVLQRCIQLNFVFLAYA